jgi:hypothetical protein
VSETLRGDTGIKLRYSFAVDVLLDMDDPTHIERATELVPANIASVLERNGFAFAGVEVRKRSKTRPVRAPRGGKEAKRDG